MVEKKNKYNYQILSEDLSKFDLSFKVLLLGNSFSGKSKILLRLNTQQYDDAYLSTIGFEFAKFNIKINDIVVTLQIWDCCGIELYRALISNFYRTASMVILVYAINDKESFNDINKWLKDITKYSETINFKFLIGSKCDLENERKVTINEGKNYAIENKFDLFTEWQTQEQEDYMIEWDFYNGPNKFQW